MLTIDLMEHLLAVVDHEDFVRCLGDQAALEALVAPAVADCQRLIARYLVALPSQQ